MKLKKIAIDTRYFTKKLMNFLFLVLQPTLIWTKNRGQSKAINLGGKKKLLSMVDNQLLYRKTIIIFFKIRRSEKNQKPWNYFISLAPLYKSFTSQELHLIENILNLI